MIINGWVAMAKAHQDYQVTVCGSDLQAVRDALVASTKEEPMIILPPPEPPSQEWVEACMGDESLDELNADQFDPYGGAATAREEEKLKKRRAGLLERIEEQVNHLNWYPTDALANAVLSDLQDELAAVESALGFPEPKEPREASDEHQEANELEEPKGPTPTCDECGDTNLHFIKSGPWAGWWECAGHCALHKHMGDIPHPGNLGDGV